MMIKTKFGDKRKSKNWIAQKNELGINPDFSTYAYNS